MCACRLASPPSTWPSPKARKYSAAFHAKTMKPPLAPRDDVAHAATAALRAHPSIEPHGRLRAAPNSTLSCFPVPASIAAVF
eukprot:8302508-Pyramimonas_sp.AAC.1